MVEYAPVIRFLTYALLLLGVAVMLLPLYLIFTTSTLTTEQIYSDGVRFLPDSHLWGNIKEAFTRTDLAQQLLNSFFVAITVIIGKTILASLTAFALVFFRLPAKNLIFGLILMTLMLPLEVRIVPTYEVVSNVFLPIQRILDWTGLTSLLNHLFGLHIHLNLNLLNSYAGLSLPLMSTAIGVFLFRQFYKTIPVELVESAKLDGAGPLRFFIDIVLPLSKTTFAALSTLIFLSTWNSYLWPLLVTTGDKMKTAAVGIAELNISSLDQLPEWNITMAAALVVLIPPVLIIALMQRFLVNETTN